MKHLVYRTISRWLVALAVLIISNSALFTGPDSAQAQATVNGRLTPLLECVSKQGNGTFIAYFGYNNRNAVVITLPLGGKNKFTPDPLDRGQPTTFQPGRIVNAFTVTWNGSDLTWALKGPDGEKRTTTANAHSRACAPTPTPIPPTNTPTNTPAPPTDTSTPTPIPPTDTPTNTPVPPTDTPTNTPVPPTDTPTPTPIPPTDTPTNTPVPPTDTPTNTPVPTTPIQTSIQIISAPANLNVQCAGPWNFTFSVLAADASQGPPTGTLGIICSPAASCPFGFGIFNAPGPGTFSISSFGDAAGDTITLDYYYTPADPTVFASSSQSNSYLILDEPCAP